MKNVFEWYGDFEISGSICNVMELPDYYFDKSGKYFPHKWDSKTSSWIMLTEQEKKIAKRV